MNTAQLATHVRLAALPEGDYALTHADLGYLNLAYPEVRVALRLVPSPATEPVEYFGWVIIECRPDARSIQQALQQLSEKYLARSADPAEDWPEKAIPIISTNEAPVTFLGESSTEYLSALDSGLKRSQKSTPLPSSDQAELTSTPLDVASDTTVPDDMELVLVHYLGSHLLQVLKRAPVDILPWWPAGSQDDTLKAAIARVHRLLPK